MREEDKIIQITTGGYDNIWLYALTESGVIYSVNTRGGIVDSNGRLAWAEKAESPELITAKDS